MDYSQLNDEALISHFRQTDSGNNDPILLKVLFQRHQQNVVKKCCYFVKDAETAHDLSQEVWIRVLTRLHQFDVTASFTAWLFQIAHNRCHDHIRQNKRLLHQEISWKIVDRMEEELNTKGVNKPTVDILQELMEKISSQGKLILKLKYEDGWSIKDIAKSLDISEGSVKMRLSRARQEMQKLLKEHRNNQTNRNDL